MPMGDACQTILKLVPKMVMSAPSLSVIQSPVPVIISPSTLAQLAMMIMYGKILFRCCLFWLNIETVWHMQCLAHYLLIELYQFFPLSTTNEICLEDGTCGAGLPVKCNFDVGCNMICDEVSGDCVPDPEYPPGTECTADAETLGLFNIEDVCAPPPANVAYCDNEGNCIPQTNPAPVNCDPAEIPYVLFLLLVCFLPSCHNSLTCPNVLHAKGILAKQTMNVWMASVFQIL